MTDSEMLKLMLEQMQSMNGHLGQIETQVGKLETQVGKLETQVGKLETQVGKLETQVGQLDKEVQTIKKQNADTFNELMNVEKQVLKNQDAIKELNSKYDTLLLKADNSTLLLKLIDRQAEEMTEIKTRVAQLESKLA